MYWTKFQKFSFVRILAIIKIKCDNKIKNNFGTLKKNPQNQWFKKKLFVINTIVIQNFKIIHWKLNEI